MGAFYLQGMLLSRWFDWNHGFVTQEYSFNCFDVLKFRLFINHDCFLTNLFGAGIFYLRRWDIPGPKQGMRI